MAYFASYVCPNLRHKFQRLGGSSRRRMRSRRVEITVGQTLADEERWSGESLDTRLWASWRQALGIEPPLRYVHRVSAIDPVTLA